MQSYRERSNRNDVALLHHFFLNERRPALMCERDFPDAAAQPAAQQPWTDAHYMPGGPLSTKVGIITTGTGALLMCVTIARPLRNPCLLLLHSHLLCRPCSYMPTS